MEFCPTCGNMLQYELPFMGRHSRFVCSTCPYVCQIENRVKIKRRQRLVRKEIEPIVSSDDMRNAPTTEDIGPKILVGDACIFYPSTKKHCLKLIVQPCSSLCCERNWNTYSFIYSVKINQIDPKRVEDLIYVHSNIPVQLLSMKDEGYTEGEIRLWGICGDVCDSVEFLDELDLKAMCLLDDRNGEDEFLN
ncbi:hypothetical protein CR513_23412, partial [Mucuna pruriens]